MTYEEFVSRLEGVRGNKALCPAHDDRQASLTHREAEDGKILVTCWRGCSLEQICDAMGIPQSDLFPPQEDIKYTYVDEQGRPLYDKIRKPNKEFWYQRYVGSSTERGLDGVDKVLYHLDELVNADPDEFVWITEGEKDAEALRSHGAVATTMGGVNDWRPEFAEYFRDRFVRVCLDNDQPGRKAACDIMLALRGIAGSVRLREAAKGKDAYDHFAAGYELDDFKEPSLFPTLNWRERIPEPPSVWHRLVYQGDLVLLPGMGKLGKSWLTMALSVIMANGGGVFLGRDVIGGRVLYFDEENPPDVIQSRFLRLGLERLDNVQMIANGGLRLDTHPEKLMQQALMFQPDLIVVDSLARVHGKDENSFAEMSEILNLVLKPLARDSGAAVLLIHHTDKAGNSARGSSDIENAVDAILNVRGTPGEGRFSISMKGRRGRSEAPLEAEIRDLPGIGTRLELIG